MIARLTVGVPFAIAVPEGAQFPAYSYDEDGVTVVARPPGVSDQPFTVDVPAELELDGSRGFVANALQFDFHKPEFDRTKGSMSFDPPMPVMQNAVASLITRLRHVTRASQIHSIDFPTGTSWRLQYLDDAGKELAEDPARVRARGGRAFKVSLVNVTPSTWEAMHDLDPEWRPPVWGDILLDSVDALPSIGTSIVLAATAIEVFAADVLDRLASGGDIPEDVWRWINDRADWEKAPSTEEQLDRLLKHFTGHSLKDETVLWQSFRELRTARNKFVHEGVARVGGVPVDLGKARDLVSASHKIVAVVRDWLPEEQRWPQPEVKTQFSMTLPIVGDLTSRPAT